MGPTEPTWRSLPRAPRPAEAAAYLAELRRTLEGALGARRAWAAEVRALLAEGAGGSEARLLAGAARIGRTYGGVFGGCRDQMERLRAPLGCDALHAQGIAWFRELARACRVMEEAAASGDVQRLLDANGHLVAACEHARAFNDAYASASRALRGVVGDESPFAEPLDPESFTARLPGG